MKKPTENSIQEKLQSLEYAYNEQAWVALQERLAQPPPPEPQKRKRPWLIRWFFWLGAGLILAATTWAFWSKPSTLGSLEIGLYEPSAAVAPASAVGQVTPPASPTSMASSGEPTIPPATRMTMASTARVAPQSKRGLNNTGKLEKTVAEQRQGAAVWEQQVSETAVSNPRPLTEERNVEAIPEDEVIPELAPLPTLLPSSLHPLGQSVDSMPGIAIARKEYRQSFSLELGGGSGWGGIRYEHRVGRRMRMSTGLGLYAENQLHLSLPLGLEFEKPFGSQANPWFWGGGTTFTYFQPLDRQAEQGEQPFWTVFPHLSFARYSQSGFVLKVRGGVLLESRQGKGTPWAGLSIGRAF